MEFRGHYTPESTSPGLTKNPTLLVLLLSILLLLLLPSSSAQLLSSIVWETETLGSNDSSINITGFNSDLANASNAARILLTFYYPTNAVPSFIPEINREQCLFSYRGGGGNIRSDDTGLYTTFEEIPTLNSYSLQFSWTYLRTDNLKLVSFKCPYVSVYRSFLKVQAEQGAGVIPPPFVDNNIIALHLTPSYGEPEASPIALTSESTIVIPNLQILSDPQIITALKPVLTVQWSDPVATSFDLLEVVNDNHLDVKTQTLATTIAHNSADSGLFEYLFSAISPPDKDKYTHRLTFSGVDFSIPGTRAKVWFQTTFSTTVPFLVMNTNPSNNELIKIISVDVAKDNIFGRLKPGSYTPIAVTYFLYKSVTQMSFPSTHLAPRPLYLVDCKFQDPKDTFSGPSQGVPTRITLQLDQATDIHTLTCTFFPSAYMFALFSTLIPTSVMGLAPIVNTDYPYSPLALNTITLFQGAPLHTILKPFSSSFRPVEYYSDRVVWEFSLYGPNVFTQRTLPIQMASKLNLNPTFETLHPNLWQVIVSTTTTNLPLFRVFVLDNGNPPPLPDLSPIGPNSFPANGPDMGFQADFTSSAFQYLGFQVTSRIRVTVYYSQTPTIAPMAYNTKDFFILGGPEHGTKLDPSVLPDVEFTYTLQPHYRYSTQLHLFKTISVKPHYPFMPAALASLVPDQGHTGSNHVITHRFPSPSNSVPVQIIVKFTTVRRNQPALTEVHAPDSAWEPNTTPRLWFGAKYGIVPRLPTRFPQGAGPSPVTLVAPALQWISDETSQGSPNLGFFVFNGDDSFPIDSDYDFVITNLIVPGGYGQSSIDVDIAAFGPQHTESLSVPVSFGNFPNGVIDISLTDVITNDETTKRSLYLRTDFQESSVPDMQPPIVIVNKTQFELAFTVPSGTPSARATATIELWEFKPLGTTPVETFSTTPTMISAGVASFSLGAGETTLISQLNFPSQVSLKAFFRLIPDSNQSLPPIDSMLFTILPSCYSYPLPTTTSTSSGQLHILAAFPKVSPETCPCRDQGGIEIECPTLPSLPWESPASRCILCSQNHLQSCDESNFSNPSPCTCIPGWEGQTCNSKTDCAVESQRKCGNRGYLPASPAPVVDVNIVSPNEPHLTLSSQNDLSTAQTTCPIDQPCSCYNAFSGDRCTICTLHCNNDGRPWKDCDRCGCSEGWTGSDCSCRGVKGTLTINLYNEFVRVTGGRLSSANTAPTTLTSTHNTKDFNTSLLDSNQYGLISVVEAVYPALMKKLTKSDTGKYSFTMQPSDENQYYTTFTFRLTHGCPESNPLITTSDDMRTVWDAFTIGFVQDPVIQSFFSLHIEPQVIDDDLVPLPATLPPPGEEFTEIVDPDNSSVGLSYTVIIGAVLIMAVLSGL